MFFDGGGHLDAKPIPNVTTFHESLPNSDGSFTSRVFTMWRDHAIDNRLMEDLVTASWSRSHPSIITEKEEKSAASKSLPSALSTANSLNGGTTAGESLDTMHTLQLLNSIGTDRLAAVNTMTEIARGTKRRNQEMRNEVQLDDGRKVARQVLAELPDDAMAFRQARIESVFMTMGVPLSMVSSSASTTQKKNSSGDNTLLVFLNAQKKLKLELLDHMRTIYTNITLACAIKKHVEEAKTLEEASDTDAVKRKIQVDIEMSGLPSDEVLLDMYYIGLLKPESLKKYMTARHGISEDSWVEGKPELSIEDLNGVRKDGPTAPKPKKKKK